MNRLFLRTAATIFAALLILVALLAALTMLSLQRSLAEWDIARRGELASLAEKILTDPSVAGSVPDNAPLFVYDAAKNLVFSNRGQGGRQRNVEQPMPILADGHLLGYYQAGDMRFVNDAANSRFLETLRRSLWVGLGLALSIATAFAFLFSRSLTAPAARVARSLDRIALGDLSEAPEEKGAREIALIGASANRLRLQLLREQALRRQWVHDVAHDLRTPVAALSAQFEGMRDGVLNVSAERLDKVLRELGRVRELVSDLEELMRLESPEMHLALDTVDFGVLVEDVRNRFDHVLEAKKISFRSEVLAGTIQGDPALIQRAVSNFVANAARHCAVGGTITVTVRPGNGAVVLSVANTGDRIPIRDLERVFDRLYRGERARESAGSGLGLTIARRIAHLHGGEVTIANRPDGVAVEMLLRATTEPA